MTANIRTLKRTVCTIQRFAVSQKNRTEAITISPFSLALPYRTENRRFSTLSCTKTGSTQPKLSAACFVVQSCLADADFAVFSNYCLIGTRPTPSAFCVFPVYNQAKRRAPYSAIPASCATSASVTALQSPSTVYFRQPAAAANSTICCGSQSRRTA